MKQQLDSYIVKNRDHLPEEYQNICLDLSQYIHNTLGDLVWREEQRKVGRILKSIKKEYPLGIPEKSKERVRCWMDRQLLDLSMTTILPSHLDNKAFIAANRVRESYAWDFPPADIDTKYYSAYGKYFRLLFDRILAGFIPRQEQFSDVASQVDQKLQITAMLLDAHDFGLRLFENDPQLSIEFAENKRLVAGDLKQQNEDYAAEVLLHLGVFDAQMMKNHL